MVLFLPRRRIHYSKIIQLKQEASSTLINKSKTILSLAIVAIFAVLTPIAKAGSGNAEVSRTRNLQFFEMEPIGDVHVTRTKNLQFFETVVNEVHITRTLNLQFIEMGIIGDVHVTRTKNLQFFEMTSPVYEYDINITNLVITDQYGQTKSNFTRGEMAQFNFTIMNSGNIGLKDGLVSVMILNPLNEPEFLFYTYETVYPGGSKQIVIGYRVPTDAYLGNYIVKVMVFTDWPSKGGVGLDIKMSSFIVS